MYTPVFMYTTAVNPHPPVFIGDPAFIVSVSVTVLVVSSFLFLHVLQSSPCSLW